MSHTPPDSDPWLDPTIIGLLCDGRSDNDIMLLSCPSCERYGYYDQGSHFYCQYCENGWYVCSEEESPPPDRPYIYADDMVSLSDIDVDVDEDVP